MQLIDPIDLAQFFVCAFFCVLFLQSGLDKVFDFSGNIGWMTPHFASSPLKAQVPVLLSFVMVLELSAGATCGVGAVMLFFGRYGWGIVGLGLACLALCCLFAGQRIAKDYAGAATLATYFGVALVGLVVFSM
jgi:hypothetical protein